MERPKSPKMGLKMMKSLQCLRVPNDEFFLFRALSVICLCSPSSVSFLPQLQRGERWGERRGSFWKQPGKGTSPLSLTWSEDVCDTLYHRKTHRKTHFLPHLRSFLSLDVLLSAAQWERSSKSGVQGLCGEYATSLCSLQGAEAMHHKAAPVWSRS